MSGTINQVFVEEFVSEAKQAYQGSAMLRHAVRTKRGVVGNKVHFPLLGKVRALPKIHRQDVVPSNPQWTRPEANMSDWHVADYTDVFEDIKTNVDERANLAQSFMMAIGRQEDQFVIDALEDAGTGFSTVQVGSSVNTKFQVKDTQVGKQTPNGVIAQSLAVMLNKELPENGEYFALLPGHWYEAFAQDRVNINKFYGETEMARMGLKGRRLMSHGVECIFMGDRKTSASAIDTVGQGWEAGGTSANPGSGVGYVWEKRALGLAYGRDPETEISWIPEKLSWLVCMAFSAGAVAIDPDGIVKITNGPRVAGDVIDAS